MKKAILNFGKVLNKNEQQKINGGKVDSNPKEYCVCYNVNYLVNGEITTEYPTSGPVVAVGFSAIWPTPACCIKED